MTKQAATTSAPMRRSRLTAATAVPPVAIEVVDQDDALARADRVRVDLDLVDAVFERIGDAHRLVRQLALLADRHEAGRELMRHRAAEDEAARLDPGHLVDLAAGVRVDEFIDGAAEGARIAEQRGDVAEDDAGLRDSPGSSGWRPADR